MTNESFMKPANPRILTINGGSSSIKFALFEAGDSLQRILEGGIERIGLPEATLRVKGLDQADNFSRLVTAPDHTMAVVALMDWIEERSGRDALTAVGHRVVHGGPKYSKPQRITAEMVEELHQLSPFDPEHLPREIELIEAFRQRHPTLPQVACFDTAFHRTMPRVARLLPIPRRYEAAGVRRYGFHGLSYAFLMEELARLGDPAAAKGRVILAHLGNGASLAAVRDGKSIDTSMGFTPTAGLVMSTRSGDLDPGLVYYLARTERMTAAQFQEMVNHESGLLGVSETSSDMRDLLARETQGRAGGGSGRAVLLSGQEMDRRLRRGAGRTGHARLRGRHRRKRAAHPRADLRRTRLSRHRTEPEAQCEECTADFAGRRSRQGAGHPHRRGAHDREVRCPRPQSRLNSENLTMKTNTLTPELLHKMDAYWRAANYLSVGQIYLYDNPLLKRPLTLADVKHMLLGHWGTTPGRTSSTCT